MKFGIALGALNSHFHVDATEEAVDLIALSDVDLGGDDAATRRLDRVGGAIEIRDVAVADREMGTEVCKGERDRFADPDRGARDDRDPIRQQRGGRLE